MDDEGGRDDEVEKFHISKRARYNKTSVVLFDDKDRKEYLGGFHKRKNKRRQIALEQLEVKKRHKRLQERRERRQAVKDGSEDVSKSEGGGEPNDAHAGEEQEELQEAASIANTVTYEEKETMTVVNVTPINPETDDEEEGVEKMASLDKDTARVDVAAAKVKKPKFKMPKKPRSEKRTRKLSRREKSVPKNLRSKKRKRK